MASIAPAAVARPATKRSCGFLVSSLLHWGFDDPAVASGSEAERMIVFRRVRDEIGDRIYQFLEE